MLFLGSSHLRTLAPWLLVALGASLGYCQDLSSYAVAHPFGLALATTTRQSAMGGSLGCVADVASGNPAFAAVHEKGPEGPGGTAGAGVSATRFDHGPNLVSERVWVAAPVQEGVGGFQATFFHLSSNPGTPVTFPSGQAALDLTEEDLGLQYGRRLGARLSAGIGISPTSRITLKFATPTGLPLWRIDAKSDIGGRLGLAYQYADSDYVGVVGDYYQETASGAGLAAAAQRGVFHTGLVTAGISRHLQRGLMVVAEYQRATSSRGDQEQLLAGWHLGAEALVTSTLALRAGSDDGHLTAGLGFANGSFRLDYAYLYRWNDDVVRSIFGRSATHQLEAVYHW